MIQFPETAQSEWQIVAEAAQAEENLRRQIERDTKVDVEVEKMRIRHGATSIFQQELDADLTPTLEMNSLADYQANPAAAPADLIEGVLKENGLCIMVGPAGSGKSTAGLQMLHSLLTGEDWLGQPAEQLTGSAGILSYDMDAPMMFDWMAGFPNLDASKVSIVNAYKRGNPLGVPQMRAQIAEHWKRIGVEVIMLDSFSASFFAENENDSASVQNHYRDMIKFALTECEARALIIVAHSSEGSPHKIRGSSVHHGVADSIVGVAKDQPNEQRSIRMVKYRAARGQHQMNPVVVTAPDDVTHLVSLDVGAMNLAGMQLPSGAVAQAFPVLPDPTTPPDTDSDSETGDDDL